MAAGKEVKPKRQKKKKSRTEVFSSESESEGDSTKKNQTKTAPGKVPEVETATKPKEMSDAEIRAAFMKYYMEQATTELAEDLDKVRGADDFKDDALALLIGALQQGTSMFSIDEQRRVVMAGMKKGC